MPTSKKIVLITGASSGIGKRTAELLLKEGYTVYTAARRVERMRELGQLGARVVHMDVTDDASVESGVELLIEEQGRIDVLLNNAGYGSYGTIENIPIDEIKQQFEVNVFGVARLIKAVVPHMRKQKNGLVINMASVISHISTPGLGWCAASKHAVAGMSHALRMELKPLGINVVMIEPGGVKTDFNRVAFEAMDRVEIPEDYKQVVSGFKQFAERAYENSPTPDGTAEAVLTAIKAHRPKIKYVTTLDSWILPKVRRFLGDRMFDWAILSQLRK